MSRYKMRRAHTHRPFARIAIVGLFGGLLLLLASTAGAADQKLFETTVFGGYRYGGQFENADNTDKFKLKSSPSFGVTFNLKENDDAYYELTYSKQNAKIDKSAAYDMSIEYLHIGGILEFADSKDKVIPYFVLTVGATRFTPTASGFNHTIEPSVALGGGVKIPLTKNIGLRAEVRGYATFVNPDSHLFCEPSPTALTCETNVQGHTLLQAQGLIGITIGF